MIEIFGSVVNGTESPATAVDKTEINAACAGYFS
jgi:hypothetical protein